MPEYPGSELALVGAGALGQAFAGLLAVSGQPATLLATPASVGRLLAAGRLRLGGVVNHAVPVAPAPAPVGTVGVTADASRLPAGAGLLFATKGHQLAGAIAAVRAAWPAASDRAAWVGGIQNGLVKDDLLAAAFGAERVVGAVTILAGQREADGTVLVTSRGGTYLGEFDAAPSPRVLAAVAALQRADIPVEAAPDIRSVLWSKACNAAGIFGVSALTRLAGPAMLRRPDLFRAYLSLIREVEAIASAYHVTLGDYINFPIRTYLTTPEATTIARLNSQPLPPTPPGARPALPSMTADLLAGRPLEVDAVFSDLIDRADRAGVPVPRLSLARDLIRGIDPGHYPE